MKRTAIVLGVALIATGAIGVVGTQPVNAQEGVTRTPIGFGGGPEKSDDIHCRVQTRGKDREALSPRAKVYLLYGGTGSIGGGRKPPVDLKPGVAIYFQSDPDKPTYVHEGINTSKTDEMKLLVTLITEKGRPLAIPVHQMAISYSIARALG